MSTRTFKSNNGSSASASFGGNGSDGALAISSGTTTVDLTGLRKFVLNYSSISITGTAVLAFINPHAEGTVVHLKSQGAVTLTSSATPMIDCSGLGADGGAGGTFTGSGDHAVGASDGTDGISYGVMKTNTGKGATSFPAVGAGGAIGVLATSGWSAGLIEFLGKYPQIFVGAGGGGGGGRVYADSGAPSGTVTGGTGGKGGGCLIIECKGAMNFTTTDGISVAGKNGTNGTATGGGALNGVAAGGGGGAGAGSAFIFYNALTAFTGTVTISGGTGGNATSTHANASVGGGGGGSATNAGASGTSAGSGQTGGNGGNGLSVNSLNTEIA